MSWIEECPECGSQEFDEADSNGRPEASGTPRDVIVYVCRECGTAWDAEKPKS